MAHICTRKASNFLYSIFNIFFAHNSYQSSGNYTYLLNALMRSAHLSCLAERRRWFAYSAMQHKRSINLESRRRRRRRHTLNQFARINIINAQHNRRRRQKRPMTTDAQRFSLVRKRIFRVESDWFLFTDSCFTKLN